MRNLFNIYRDKNKNITAKFKKNFKANLIITDEELNECSLPGRIRVNGDQKDHISIKEGIFISSMDIRIEDNLNSYNDFKLLLPETRRYKSEIFISTLFSELNFLSPYASLIKIDYFKKKQNYLFYENLGKEFLERNNRIEGPIIRGDERFFFDNNEKFDQIVVGRLENSNWIKNNMKNQVHISIEALTKANQIFLERYFVKSKKPPNMLIFNDNKINQFIDDEKFKKFILLTRIIGAENVTTQNDIRFYYDPIFRKFEVIFNDASVHFLNNPLRINYLNIDKFEFELINQLLFDLKKISIEKLHKKLIERGLKISKEKLEKNISNIYSRIDDINNYFKNNDFTEYKSININDAKSFIEKKILETNSIYSYSKNKNEFIFCDKNNCFIKNLNLDEIKKLLNQRYKIKKKDVVFLGYEKYNLFNKAFFDTSTWNKKSIDNTQIFFKKDTKVEINKKIKEIRIEPFNTKKIIFYKGELRDWKINYVDSEKNDNKFYELENNLKAINGCLNFYDLNFDNISINIENSKCEDGVNFVRSNGLINNLNVLNSMSDAVDFDFSKININNLNINNSKNDCIDFSYGSYKVKVANLSICNDKALSIGETSTFFAENLNIDNVNIALAVKDNSNAKVLNLKVQDSNYCSVLYRKKTEFKGAKLKISKQNCGSAINFIDKGNIFIVNEF